MDFSYEIRGTNRVRNQLRAAAAFHPDTTDPLIGRHAQNEAGRLARKPYPPAQPGQRYHRTYHLARSWRARRMTPGVHQIENMAAYAVWVVKKGMQNRQVHLNRWWTADDELRRNMPQLSKALAAELEQKLQQISGP